jgi:hypothetical protein
VPDRPTGAAFIWSLLNTRRTARRIRSGELQRRPTGRQWVRAIGSIIGSLLFVAGMGYIGGGRPAALLFPAGAIAVIGVTALIARKAPRCRSRVAARWLLRYLEAHDQAQAMEIGMAERSP